jgi:fatty-acyl-CoA synthase
VNDVSVIGVPDDTWGECVAAVIRPVAGLAPPTPEELHAYCRERLAAHKAPSLWFFVASYPTTASGKIQKFVLQDWVRDGKIDPAKLIEGRGKTVSATRG